MENQTCQNCGKDITDKRAGARFCSTSCRVSWNNKQKRKLQKEKEEERKAAKNRLPNWVLWIIRNRIQVLIILFLSLLVIFQSITLINLYQANSSLQMQLQEQEQTDSLPPS